MSDAPTNQRTNWWGDRSRGFKTLTFWLRPAFALRVINRFQDIAGFDRAIALASSALTATIPMAIVVSSIIDRLGGKDISERLIARYDLTGDGAEAVKRMFAPAGGSDTTIGLIGLFLLLLAVLSFTRAVQRLFEQTWELPPLSVRNTLNGLKWAGGLLVYLGLSGVVRAVGDHGALQIVAWVVGAPLTFFFLFWSGWVLSARRIDLWDLLPFAVVGTILLTIYSIGASVYVPHLFNSFAGRYGAIGAVFAIISALFCVMVVVVGSAAAGREIQDEMEKIRLGERPPDDEIRKEWDTLIADGRTRWQEFRGRTR